MSTPVSCSGSTPEGPMVKAGEIVPCGVWQALDSRDRFLCDELLKWDQQSLLEKCKKDLETLKSLLEATRRISEHSNLKTYICNAKTLLRQSKNSHNPLEEYDVKQARVQVFLFDIDSEHKFSYSALSDNVTTVANQPSGQPSNIISRKKDTCICTSDSSTSTSISRTSPVENDTGDLLPTTDRDPIDYGHLDDQTSQSPRSTFAYHSEFDRYLHYETQGDEALRQGSVGFVLVAGGLGERLGFDGCKLAISPSELVNETYFEMYLNYITAFSAPLVIMTSADTHEPVLRALLKLTDCNFSSDTAKHFKDKCIQHSPRKGFCAWNIRIVVQERVPCFSNSSAELSMTISNGTAGFVFKPHGHGDVHTLVYHRGYHQWFKALGVEHVLFFQDTNALFKNGVSALLGYNMVEAQAMSFLTTPRVPKEAVGVVCQLESRSSNNWRVQSVEYNQVDALLATSGGDKSDINCPHGYSPFPGNTNVFVVNADSYCTALELSHGYIAEFVNPKYADSHRETFKSPARLETMMQDISLLIGKGSSHSSMGYLRLPRWLCFSPMKNNSTAGKERFLREHLPPESALSAELDLYWANLRLFETALKLTGGTLCLTDAPAVQSLEHLPPTTIDSVNLQYYAPVYIDGDFGMSMMKKIHRIGKHVQVALARGSSVVLRGNIHISDGAKIAVCGNVTLDALADDAKIVVKQLCVYGSELWEPIAGAVAPGPFESHQVPKNYLWKKNATDEQHKEAFLKHLWSDRCAPSVIVGGLSLRANKSQTLVVE